MILAISGEAVFEGLAFVLVGALGGFFSWWFVLSKERRASVISDQVRRHAQSPLPRFLRRRPPTRRVDRWAMWVTNLVPAVASTVAFFAGTVMLVRALT